MRIRMLIERTGPRYDGRPWPPAGGEFDVPDEEGAGLCATGEAAPVAVRRAAEKAVMPAAEERVPARTARPQAPGRTR